MEKNIYGLSEGVFKACEFLGLKFPAALEGEHVPSDYFGDNFQLDKAMIKKLRSARKWSIEKFDRIYKSFTEQFFSQSSLKHTETDLNIFFCDHVLFDVKPSPASSSNYLSFEFYRKPLAARQEFITDSYNNKIRITCNDYTAISLANNKARTNALFAEFFHRDCIDTRKCTFETFKAFVEKNPRFFSKPLAGSFGIGAEIISVKPEENLEEIFAALQDKKRLLEEVIIQHEALSAFCPDTVNTIRVNTILDIHNVVHIVTTSGRFGRLGKVVDNFNGGGYSVVIDSKTGVIISDGVNDVHERVSKHPDTGKIFKGFQYPAWDKVCTAVKKMAIRLPNLRRIAWDIAINAKGEAILVEANGDFPGINIQQVPDDTGRRYLYAPLIEEFQSYQADEMQFLGWRVNNLRHFKNFYKDNPSRSDLRLQFAMSKLIPDCKSLMDLGCRKEKLAQAFCPEGVNYFPVDYKRHDKKVIACDFNEGAFPDLTADTCFCALTAEYVELLPQFLDNMCDAAQKQILMLCRPVDKETNAVYRWANPFLVDFTEDFLIKTMAQNNFQLSAEESVPDNSAIILYDFRRI